MKQKFKFKSGSPRKLIEECSQGQHLWGVKETGSEGEVELRGTYNRSLSSGEIWTWVGLLQVCSLETRQLGAYSTEVASHARWVWGRSQNYIPALWSSSCIQVCAAGWWNLLKLGRRRSEDRVFSQVSGWRGYSPSACSLQGNWVWPESKDHILCVSYRWSHRDWL